MSILCKHVAEARWGALLLLLLAVQTVHAMASDAMNTTQNQLPLSSCTPSSSSISETACDSYTSPSGKYSWISTGTYLDTIPNAGGCDSVITISLTVNTTPSITSTTPGSNCGPGSVSLSATSSAGTVLWYDSLTGGSMVATGSSFTTPSLIHHRTYYIAASNNGCTTSVRTPIIATIDTIPMMNSFTSAELCDSGTAVITAVPNTGTVYWYDQWSGGVLLDSGTSFTTPMLHSTTTYYPEIKARVCNTGGGRGMITVTINQTPSVQSTQDSLVCNQGSTTLMATPTAGTIQWYSSAVGGTSLHTGTAFSTPVVASNTTYYAEAVNGQCISPTRMAVQAIVLTKPSVISTVNDSVCDSGSVVLGASASAGNLNWYTTANGGTSLGTGTSFITPSIGNSTTYYVDATDSICVSPRTPVTAVINQSTTSSITEITCVTYVSPSGKYTFSQSGLYTDTLVNSIGCDSIIHIDLTINASDTTINKVACDEFVSPSGKYTYTASGLYTDTVSTSFGCDSVIHINLTINTVDTLVTVADQHLIANASQATYRWYTCDPLVAIDGANDKTYKAKTNGHYAVLVTQNGCTALSGCHTIDYYTGVVATMTSDDVRIFPNPVQSILHIDPGTTQDKIEVSVTNSLGQALLHEQYLNHGQISLDLGAFPSGLYFLKLRTSTYSSVHQILLD